jgi:hypothetical protein
MTLPSRPAASVTVRPSLVLCLRPLLVFLLLLPAGCAVFGIAASAIPEPDIPARYAGLKGHSVAVIVWSDRGLQIDYPSLRLDVASGIQAKLQQAAGARNKDMKETTFPYPAASVVRFQEDHPETADQPIVDVAPRLKADRVIYVELQSLQTRADDSVDLYLGTALASVKVIAVDPATGKGKTVYEESDVGASFPPKAPPEGYPGVGDAKIYRGTVDRLTTLIAIRFFSHPAT